jgi:hypothetical protein
MKKMFYVAMCYDTEEQDWCWYYIPEQDEEVICRLPEPQRVEFDNAIIMYHWHDEPENNHFKGDLMIMVIEDIERRAWNSTWDTPTTPLSGNEEA